MSRFKVRVINNSDIFHSFYVTKVNMIAPGYRVTKTKIRKNFSRFFVFFYFNHCVNSIKTA